MVLLVGGGLESFAISPLFQILPNHPRFCLSQDLFIDFGPVFPKDFFRTYYLRPLAGIKFYGLALLFLSLNSWSKENKPLPPTQDEEFTLIEEAEPQDRGFSETANEIQRDTTRKIHLLSNRLDSFFGESRTDDEASYSTLRVEQSQSWTELKGFSNDFQVRFNLRLRNIERWGEKIEESLIQWLEKKEEEEKQRKDGSSREPGPASRAKKEIKLWNINWENRAGYTNKLVYFSILRGRRNFNGKDFVHRFSQQIGWSNTEEWQARTELSSDRDIAQNWLYRFGHGIQWAMTSRDLSTSHGPSWLQSIDDFNSISYDIRYGTGLDGQAWYGDSYSIGMTYRKLFSNRWLYFQVTPQVVFERPQNFKRDLQLLLSLEAVTGRH